MTAFTIFERAALTTALLFLVWGACSLATPTGSIYDRTSRHVFILSALATVAAAINWIWNLP